MAGTRALKNCGPGRLASMRAWIEARTARLAAALAAGLLLLAPVLPIPALSVPVAIAASPMPQDAYAAPPVTTARLENGLEVVVIPDHRAPVVTHMIWYRAGAADEPPGKSGIAHFLEHLLFKGTKNAPEGEFSRKVAEIGGEENAFTSADFTAYFQRVSPEALEMVMTYEADRMRNVVIEPQDVETEKKVILEERRSRVDSSPSALLSETVRATLYKHHPYGTPVIGWEHEMLGLTLEDALDFYDRFYRPSNAVLVIAGDIEPEEAMALARKTYGAIEYAGPAPDRTRLREPEPRAARTVEYFDERVSVPSWGRIYLAPSYTTAKPGEAEALDLLSEILGGSTTSRLYRRLVIDDEIATSAVTWYGGSSMDEGTFYFSATPRGDTPPETLQTVIDEEIALLLEEGITQEELDRVRNRFLRSAMLERDSQVTMARMYGSALTTGGTVEDIAEWPSRLMQVTVEQVNQAARTYLQPERSVTSWLRAKPGNNEG